MMGDVPVGVFLSGGLDSSLVAAIAARWAAREGTVLHTFAVGTDGSPDLLAARTVAEFLGTDHHEIDYRAAEALESLPNVVRAIESFDPGLVRSAVPNYMLAAHDPPARARRAHRRGRRRAVRGLRVPARVHRARAPCAPSSSAPSARCTTSTSSAATA